VGLACKNAILIVEFAKHLQEQGRDAVSAVLEAARLRLRPILMTSFAFIMGVVPLMLAGGAGAEIRHALGVTVFAGMLGVTFFGLLLTPVFYVLMRRLSARRTAVVADAGGSEGGWGSGGANSGAGGAGSAALIPSVSTHVASPEKDHG